MLVNDFFEGNDKDPCWKGYRQYGMKEKDGKQVPNCVPEGQTTNEVEQRFSEPLTGWHIVYRSSGNPVHGTPSFESKDDAQKFLMTKLFKNHHEFKVVHTAHVGVSEESEESAADSKIASLEKKHQALQNQLELARERRKMRGQRIQSPAEIKLSSKISDLGQQIHLLKQGVSEGAIIQMNDDPATLRRLAKLWWTGTPQEYTRATKMLEKMGWEIYEDDDDIVLSKGDESITFSMDELEGITEGTGDKTPADYEALAKKHTADGQKGTRANMVYASKMAGRARRAADILKKGGSQQDAWRHYQGTDKDNSVTEGKPITAAADTATNAKKLWQYVRRNLNDLASDADFEAGRNELYIDEKLNNLFTTTDGQPVKVAFDVSSKIKFDNGILHIPVVTMWKYRGIITAGQFVKDVARALGEQGVAEGQKKKVQDRKTGEWYDPQGEIEKMYSDPEYVAMVQRMKREEGHGWPRRKEQGVAEDTNTHLADLTKIKTDKLRELYSLHRHYGQKDPRSKASAKRAAAELTRRGEHVPVDEQAVAEVNDYFKRRQREEDIIAGKKPARKKAPAQTSDYAKRREQQKKQELGENSEEMVRFVLDSERAYEAVMNRFSHVVEWDKNDYMMVPARLWPKVAEVAHDADGIGAEIVESNMAEEQRVNPKDKITVDVPLFLRLMEYAREDAKTDMDLHNVTDHLIELSATGQTLTMADYSAIVKQNSLEESMPSRSEPFLWDVTFDDGTEKGLTVQVVQSRENEDLETLAHKQHPQTKNKKMIKYTWAGQELGLSQRSTAPAAKRPVDISYERRLQQLIGK